MNISHKALTVMIGGIVVMTLLAFLMFSGLAATAAWLGGSGNGSGPVFCQPATPAAASTTPGTTPTPAGTTSSCVAPSNTGAQVVAWARAMAAALYVDPACAAWANGTYQCVSFVRGAYSQVYPMTLSANAFDLWAVYATQPGWIEIPAAAAPPGQRGIPLPGDVMVFKDASIGHVAIVMSVELPTATTNGAITFSNANSVSPYTTMPLLPDLTVDTANWPGYTVWGYIRPAGGAAAQVHTSPSSGQTHA